MLTWKLSVKMFCEGLCLIYAVIKERLALGEMFTFGSVTLLKG